jgi:hypothetical protein
MSITDELRKYISGPARWGISHICEENIVAIADRIDAEHEKAVQEKSIRVYTSDADMEHDGWIRLPKDANGEPIRFKDKVTVPWSEKVYEVGGFSYQENVHLGTMTIWINVHEDGEYKALCASVSCRHYKPPTVEDVLREFATEFNRDDTELCDEEIIERFAAKLQLRGDGE